MLKSPVFRKYFLPGLVFQSVLIGGGYGTGRELVEFFLTLGPLSGLLAMLLVSTVIWSIVFAVTFELARLTRAYDYRTFTRLLLGRAWWLYEICYLVLLPLVVAVIAAATGSIMEETFHLPYYLGVGVMMLSIAFLVFKGTPSIEKFLASWSLVLYAIYVVFFILCLSQFGDQIYAKLFSVELHSDWILNGIKYAGYNLGGIPAILFALRHIETRKEAVGAGLLAGPIGIIPGVFFYLSMVGQYPGIVEQTVPANYLLTVLGSKAFQLTFQIMLLGTLIETGTGLIHAFNERIASVFKEKSAAMPTTMRPAIAVGILIVATIGSRFGLIHLIEKGYGTITWGFLILFVVPVLTIGVWRILRHKEG